MLQRTIYKQVVDVHFRATTDKEEFESEVESLHHAADITHSEIEYVAGMYVKFGDWITILFNPNTIYTWKSRYRLSVDGVRYLEVRHTPGVIPDAVDAMFTNVTGAPPHSVSSPGQVEVSELNCILSLATKKWYGGNLLKD